MPGQRRHQRYCRRTAADHNNLFAGVVDLLWPGLGMHEDPAEALHATKFGNIPVVITVVTGAGEDERARELDRLARIGALGDHVPASLLRRPVRRDDPVLKPDTRVDTCLSRRVLEVLQDRAAVNYGLFPHPGAERIAQCEHVGVRPHAGIPKEVPCPADGVARLEDHVRTPMGTATSGSGRLRYPRARRR